MPILEKHAPLRALETNLLIILTPKWSTLCLAYGCIHYSFVHKEFYRMFELFYLVECFGVVRKNYDYDYVKFMYHFDFVVHDSKLVIQVICLQMQEPPYTRLNYI